MTKEQVAATDAMVNMDTLGLDRTEVWASHSDKRLTSALVNIAKRLGVPITGVKCGAGRQYRRRAVCRTQNSAYHS